MSLDDHLVSSNWGRVFRRDRLFQALRLDPMLLLIITVISAFGLVVLYSAADRSEATVEAQIVRLALGVGVMFVIAQFPSHLFMRLAPWLYLLGILFLVLIYPLGTEVNGSRRWLRIPGVFQFQPSEVMKLCLPMALAWYLHERHLPPKPKHVMVSLCLLLLPCGLIVLQPDLGTALIIAGSGLLVLLLAGISWRWVAWSSLLGVVSAPAFWFLIKDYQRERILTLFDPERDPLGSGWNIIQSTIAIGSGGLSGKGLLQGTQSHLNFLPESSTDFIIAVLAEELGFLGVFFLLFCYSLLILRGVIISVNAQDTFGRLLSGSITFTMAIYVFVNIGMVSGILPVVGVPLPLVSFGGTSILTLFVGFGLLMSIHSHRRIML